MATITRYQRAHIKQQRPCVLWLTGLSGAGKSTLANLLEKELFELGYHTYLLDGDVVRTGLCKDLGFSAADRNENIRRVGAAAKLLTDAGLIVLTATISPFQSMRSTIRQSFAASDFIEIFVDTPLAVCEERDSKGLYRKARAGKITDFTGIDSAYEPPKTPEIHLRTDRTPVQACVVIVIDYLRQRGYLPR